jgi:hypothetical protein
MAKHTTPAHPFARRPPSWYRRLTAAFHAPQGGPPEAEVIPHRIDCGSLVLRFPEPLSVYGSGPADPDQIDLDDGEFAISELDVDRTCHPTIELAVTAWIYKLPRWHYARALPIPIPPYADITAHWQLERVKHGIRLKPGDSAMLEDYLRHDYIAYLESEGGPNWKVREEAYKGKTLAGDPLPQYRIDYEIEHGVWSPPEDYAPLVCGPLHWLRYFWNPHGRPRAIHYTTALLPDVLLTACFRIGDTHSEWEAWWNLFQEDCENLVKAIVCERKSLPGAD